MRLHGVMILATACALLLVACGQKGPLTLPPPPAEQSKAERPSDRSYPSVPSTSEKK
jgi:predicted small lipoprotein YifL